MIFNWLMILWLPEEEARRLAEEVVQALSGDEEEGEGGSRTGWGHRRGKKRTHKSYYAMTEKERFVLHQRVPLLKGSVK
jgi:hypothetical protein